MAEARSRGMIPGTVDLVILKTLDGDGEALHGFAISERVDALSDGVLELRDAALYQALHRMERQGLVESEWGRSENNRRAKFYRITGRGRRHLAEEERGWSRHASAVFRVLARADGGEA